MMHGADRGAGQRQTLPLRQVQRVGDHPRLQAGEQEDHAFDQIDHQVPDEEALQAGGGRDEARAVPADVTAADHGGQHARAAQAFRHPEGGEGRQQREHHFHPRLARPSGAGPARPSRSARPQTISPATIGREFAARRRQRESAPPSSTAATAKLNRIRAVASFTSPSPSRMVRMRLGRAKRRAMAMGATASGGDTTAPSTKPTASGRPSRYATPPPPPRR